MGDSSSRSSAVASRCPSLPRSVAVVRIVLLVALALVFLLGVNAVIITLSCLPGYPAIIPSSVAAALSFSMQSIRVWIGRGKAHHPYILQSVAITVLCAQAALLVLLGVRQDGRFAQASNILCVVHGVSIEYSTRIWIFAEPPLLRALFFIVVFAQAGFLGAAAYLLFHDHLQAVWALVPLLFSVYVGVFFYTRSGTLTRSVMPDCEGSTRRRLTVWAFASVACLLISAVLAAVGTVLGFEALFSCEFVLAQAPCVQAIVLVWVNSMKRCMMQDAETGVRSQASIPSFIDPRASVTPGLVSHITVEKEDYADEGADTTQSAELSQSTIPTSGRSMLVMTLPVPPPCYKVPLPPRRQRNEGGSGFTHLPMASRHSI